jgi:hypothetical protein
VCQWPDAIDALWEVTGELGAAPNLAQAGGLCPLVMRVSMVASVPRDDSEHPGGGAFGEQILLPTEIAALRSDTTRSIGGRFILRGPVSVRYP